MIKHAGIDEDRLVSGYSELEKIFAEVWAEQNKPKSWLNYGQGILQDLMVKNGKWEYAITQRDATIVATVIQWLGTNCGQGFLHEVLSKHGMYLGHSTQSRVKPPKSKTLKRSFAKVDL